MPKNRNPSEEQIDIGNRKYVASVYAHTLFLYSITKAHKYQIVKESDKWIKFRYRIGDLS